MRSARAAFIAAMAALAPWPCAAQDAVADFYRGNQVTIQVGFGAGGGYDTMTRLFAPYLGKHVPGSFGGDTELARRGLHERGQCHLQQFAE